MTESNSRKNVDVTQVICVYCHWTTSTFFWSMYNTKVHAWNWIVCFFFSLFLSRLWSMWRSHLCVSLLCVQPFAEFRAFLVWRKLLKSRNVVTLAFIRSKKIRHDFSLHRRKSWNWMNIPVLQKPSKTFWTLKSRGRPDDALFFQMTFSLIQTLLFSLHSLRISRSVHSVLTQCWKIPQKVSFLTDLPGVPTSFVHVSISQKIEKIVEVCVQSC